VFSWLCISFQKSKNISLVKFKAQVADLLTNWDWMTVLLRYKIYKQGYIHICTEIYIYSYTYCICICVHLLYKHDLIYLAINPHNSIHASMRLLTSSIGIPPWTGLVFQQTV
jgi:hypothetical protein